MDPNAIPEKPRCLLALREAGFAVPDFVYLSAADFAAENFDELQAFFARRDDHFKVIARSAHPAESQFKGGTFDSMETLADVGGIRFARNRMIRSARNAKRLSIARQQRFSGAPEIDPEEMGVIVMPFIEGASVMAKMVGETWEFGYGANPGQKVSGGPFITGTPHTLELLDRSEEIQKLLGFRCEIEYILSREGTLFAVQARDISHIEMLEPRADRFSIELDGVRRIRRRRNYRERPIFVMNNRKLYLDVISLCEDVVQGWSDPSPTLEDILGLVNDFKERMETFAMRNERFGVLGLSVETPVELYQIAGNYLQDTPEWQKELSAALQSLHFHIDCFLAETDTLIAKEHIEIAMCTHDAYGIDTLRNPLWSVYWKAERHDRVLRRLREIGFRTGDTVGVEIDAQEKPVLHRL
ncbi:MAG: hypothetical protein ACLFRG_10815 [Desulfococcaceae bacterium]